MSKKIYNLVFTLLTFSLMGNAQIKITDADLTTGTYNWTKDNVYLLDGYVYLEAGGVLNIEAGTVIQGKVNAAGSNPASLIITKGAKIFAEGTAMEPIIFTSEIDNGAITLDQTDRKLWGGLIILGSGNIARPGNIEFVEGIPNETRTEYGGGTNPDDTESSGVLKYVSIRHGGAELAPGDEINGLTLGGVGSGTVLDYIEVYANSDDGIEWFGGTAQVKHLVSAFCGDDGMDYDFGWRGKGQFWLVVQDADLAGNAGEHDGAKPDGEAPFSKPTISNATYIGSGVGASASNEFALLFRDNAGGTYSNSIFTGFKDRAISIEDLPDDPNGNVDAYQNLINGDLVISNNIWFDFGAGSTLNDIVDVYADGNDANSSAVIDHLSNNGNTIVDPMLCGISRTADGNFIPTLEAESPALEGATVPTDDFFQQVTYKGAFDQTTNWAAGWTALSQYGHFGTPCVTTSIENPFENKGFVLNQNNPNPANDITTFNYTLPTQSQVTMSVYDLTGRKMMTVINGENIAEGDHQIEVNVNGLPNATYVVTFVADDIVLTRKMTVLK